MVHASRLSVLAVLCAGLALAGCGRKGPLELPPGVPDTQTPAQAAGQETRVQPLTDDPGLIQPPNKIVQRPVGEKLQQQVSSPSRPINGPEVPRERRFILDPLL